MEYQAARINKENDLKLQIKEQGITDYPQYAANFWGKTPDNNYGFGTSDIRNNIEDMQKFPSLPQPSQIQSKQNAWDMVKQWGNTLADAYTVYKEQGAYGLGKKYGEPSVKRALQVQNDIQSLPISDVNKHQYISCVGSTDGLVAMVETLGGGLYKEFSDYKKKVNNPQLFNKYGGKLGILKDNFKDLTNDVKGAWKGWSTGNTQKCEELLSEKYRNKKY